MDYLKENAKNFEEVRIGAGAVEAWGVKDCPFKFDEWMKIITKGSGEKNPPIHDGGARILGSTVAFLYRLDIHEDDDAKPEEIAKILNAGQLDDGGWCKTGEKTSDIETTYRVMRAYMLLKQKPKDVKKLRKFIDSHRNEDGGYAVKPGDKSSVSGVYYCIIISKWLDELEK
jgi:prenyltransferase beta subunit